MTNISDALSTAEHSTHPTVIVVLQPAAGNSPRHKYHSHSLVENWRWRQKSVIATSSSLPLMTPPVNNQATTTNMEWVCDILKVYLIYRSHACCWSVSNVHSIWSMGSHFWHNMILWKRASYMQVVTRMTNRTAHWTAPWLWPIFPALLKVIDKKLVTVTGFHSRWNKRVDVRHPNLWIFICKLKDEEKHVRRCIRVAEYGDPAPCRKRRYICWKRDEYGRICRRVLGRYFFYVHHFWTGCQTHNLTSK